ncbi:multidrug resistance efflux transporter family protein [Poseidonibacter ostreae]|uniref:Multidrug resistance efflux transporter family protein n=1 Tax=Poseidonibacter ostreae TaxID=2654171 RepID=A0A6L4WQ74_9BACT|nr:multidrug resistance efflux transporter family protein [Poseidonibacter ostreae]KAB7884649.1 multidrug resistance efflux transporter family protein [Poseidonibacter ostreae]KAB7885957.1 multidrug resistance efflux transporter family protein [Poseidonibacter ostreae]KAB7888610.1 multidrug resistance efflux transporter family protein [Poseidonibacter ostreae]
MKNSPIFLLSLGLLSALFFSATFLINKVIANEGGHWFYSGSLRYFYTIFFISILLILYKGLAYYKSVLLEYLQNFRFWTIAGSIGFGIFYSMICFAAEYSPAWVLVTTWQLTIFASIFVLVLFGKKLNKITILSSILVVVGITIVNLSHFELSNIDSLLYSILPIVLAAFAFPYGNQMVWEEKKKRDASVLNNSFSKVFLLTIGSSPLWLVLFLFLEVGKPSGSQLINVAFISILSGVIATSIFLYARSKADSSSKIMLVDATISGEVIFTLILEVVFLNAMFPNMIGLLGMGITLVALFIMVYFDKSKV